MILRERLLSALQAGPQPLAALFAQAQGWGYEGPQGEARLLEGLLALKRDGAVCSTGLYPHSVYALSETLQADLQEGLPLRDPLLLRETAQRVLGVGAGEVQHLPLHALIARLESCPPPLRSRVELEFDLLMGRRLMPPGAGSRLLKLYPRLRRLFLEAVYLAAQAELVPARR